VHCRKLILCVQVYALAAYIEGDKAKREFGLRQRGGFFDADSGISDYCDAILDAACSKLLVLQLVRDITGAQFVEVCVARLSFLRLFVYRPTTNMHTCSHILRCAKAST
jgi:hypothetical protein